MVNLAGGFAEASDQIAPEGVAYPEGLAESDRWKLGTSDAENGVMHWHEWVFGEGPLVRQRHDRRG